jgi:hypothetical protein
MIVQTKNIQLRRQRNSLTKIDFLKIVGPLGALAYLGEAFGEAVVDVSGAVGVMEPDI